MKSPRLSLRSSGFTLIEVMIAITIMATLGVLAAQSIQQAIKSKKKIQEQLDDTSRMRDAMRLIEKDINLAYHHRDWEKELLTAMKKSQQAKPGVTPGAAGFPDPAFSPPADDPSQQNVEAPRLDPTTNFMGTDSDVHFVTMNSSRLMKNERESDHVEVGYFLKDCKNPDGNGSSKCLWRRTSPWVDSDVTKGGTEIALLENVTEFKLRYLGKGKQDWVNDWKSDKSGDGATKGNFPWAVEVSLTVQKNTDNKKGKKYSMQFVIPIHFPNNAEDDGSSTNSGGLPGASGPQPGVTPGVTQ